MPGPPDPPDPPDPSGPPAPRAAGIATARRATGNVMAVASSQLAGKVATFAWLLVAARVLDQSAFGAFSFALAAAMIVGSLVEWGFTQVMITRSSRDPASLDAAYTAAQAWQLFLGLPAYAIAILAARPALDTPGATLVLVAAVVATAAESWCTTARSAASVLQRQGGVSFAVTLQRLLIAGCAILAVVTGREVTFLALGFAVGTVLGVPLHSIALRRVGVRLDPAGLRWTHLRPLLVGSHVIGLSGVVLLGLAKLDQVLLGALDGASAVGAYAVAYRLLETVFFVVFALRAALFPLMAADPRPPMVRTTLRRAWDVLCVAYVPYAVVCLVAPAAVLDLLFGEPYGQTAASSLQWLAVVPLLFAGAYLLGTALIAVGAQRGMLLAAVSALGVNVVGDVLLIPPFGPAGAAAATAAGYTVQLLVCAEALRRRDALPSAVPGLALALGAGVPLTAVVLWLPLIPALALGAVVYLLCWTALARWLTPHRLVEVVTVLPVGVGRRVRRLLPADAPAPSSADPAPAPGSEPSAEPPTGSSSEPPTGSRTGSRTGSTR